MLPAVVPPLPYGAPAVVLIRVFDGASWDAATYRFEREYQVALGGLQVPPYLPLGTSPLILQPIPEPSSLLLAFLGLSPLACRLRRRMGRVVPMMAMLCGSVIAQGQGQFVFNNRIGTEVNARFVLPTDPPGTSSVGTNFQVHLFGGPEGTPFEQLQPLDPPSTGFRGAAGTIAAGYVVSTVTTVPRVPPASVATILVRVFDGSAWDTAAYRFEREYALQVWDHLPPNLQLGTSPLILQAIPEPSTILLAQLGLGALVWCMGRKAR